MRWRQGAAVVVASIMVITSCSRGGSGTGSTSESTTGSSVPSMDASEQADLPGGGRIIVDPGALTAGASIETTSGGDPDQTATLPEMASAGEAVNITINGGELAGQATLSWPVNSSADGSTPVIATWVDDTWVPVPSEYDAATGTVSATVDHLSWWQPWTWDLGAIAERALSSFFGDVDTSEALCDAPDLTDGYRATIDNMGSAFSGCAEVVDGTFAVSVKNRRRSSFSIELYDGWTGSVTGGSDFSSMLTQSLLDLSGRRFVVVPGGETAVIRGTVAPGGRVSMPVLQDLFTWTIDGLLLAGQVYALGSGYVGDTSTVASVVRQTSDRLETLRDGIECVGDANGLLTSAVETSGLAAAAKELLPTIWNCGKLLAPEGSPAAVVSAIVSLALTPFMLIFQLGEMAVDIAKGDDTRRLVVWRDQTPAAPVLDDCEGLDLSAVIETGTFVGLGESVCSWPWALVSFTEAKPRLSVALMNVENGDQDVVVYWTDVEDGPDVSGYTVEDIASYGPPMAVAQLLFDALGGSDAGNSAGGSDESAFPFPGSFAVPQLGTEPVRGSGCGSDGSLGETIPTGWWLGIIHDLTPTSMQLNVVCAYFGERAEAYIAECAAEEDYDVCTNYFGELFWPVDNNQQTRFVPVKPAAPLVRTSEMECPTLTSRDLTQVLTWVHIVNGEAIYMRHVCPAG